MSTSLMHPDPVVQALVDRAAVHDVVVRYTKALDRHDWTTLESLFLPDAHYTFPGGESTSAAEIVQRCSNALTRLDSSQHLLGSVEVRVDGDTAWAHSYFQAQHVVQGTPGGDTFIIAGSYEDRLVRTADGWRIAHRHQEYAWMDGNPGVVRRAAPSGGQ